MAHKGSIKGDGRLIIAPGDETNVYYEIHVFQPQIGPKFASGYLTGDLVAFNRAFEAGDVTLELEDSQLFFGDTLESGSWDMGMWAWVGSPGASALVDIFDVFDPDGAPPDGSNYYRWGSRGSGLASDEAVQDFQALLAALRSTVSRAEVFEIAAQLEEVLASEVVVIPIWSRLSVGAVHADQIGGFVHNPTQAAHTWNIERWYRLDR